MNEIFQFPPQQLPFSRKNKIWRKKHLDWATNKSFFNYSPVRNSTLHKKINYDLINGKLHMEDLMLIVNPNNINAGFIPDNIQHYPIMNSKLNVLRGEELSRLFDYRVVVTNPNAISEIENNKKEELSARLQQMIKDQSQSDEEFNAKLEKLDDYINFEWQDQRELRANSLLNHYSKELAFPILFNKGFMDALTVGEEIYICDIVGGEPTIERVDPTKVTIFRSGYSDKIEDADVVILEDYWNPGKIIDTFYDQLTKEDMKYIENIFSQPFSDSNGLEGDPRNEFIPASSVIGDDEIINPNRLFDIDYTPSLMPYDVAGNIRVIRMFWKSRRKIKKVKSYDQTSGEEIFNFYPETYVINESLGEEEEIYWINEAWEGTKIGENIYVNMKPRLVQYNRLSNPSRCHFGIVGSIYNLNGSKPFSMVDMMKPYNYLYDALHDRLNKLLAKNWGKIIQLDFAKIPAGWDIDKWMYFAKVNNIAVVDSFKEGTIGAATGKIAGGLNNASSGVIDAELGNSFMSYVNILNFIEQEMSSVAGISRQREGQISNRETVGGVERATLQSSHITEWLFATHDDVKRRAIECFLETAKIALRGKSKKFQYILADNSLKVMEIDGDEFADCDYGLIVDSNNTSQQLNQKLDALAQAALQNSALTFSTIMKLYSSCSLAEKQRMVERAEMQSMQRQQEAQQQQLQAQQEIQQQQLQLKEAEMQLSDTLNQRDNETKVLVAQINAQSKIDNSSESVSELDIANFEEKVRQFDETLNLDKERLSFDKHKAEVDAFLKKQQINKKPKTI